MEDIPENQRKGSREKWAGRRRRRICQSLFMKSEWELAGFSMKETAEGRPMTVTGAGTGALRR